MITAAQRMITAAQRMITADQRMITPAQRTIAAFRSSMTENRWKTGTFLIYLVLLCVAVARHEPWFDEAQAWLLARDAGFVELMVKYLRYEGTPGLWHILLIIPAKLGLPYVSLNIISALLSAIGAYLFMQYSPFPLVVRILYPFSYFAFYQYGVVARSYSLIPLLLFSIAIIYRDKMSRPILFFSLLILLCNVSFHGLLIAASLALMHAFNVNRDWDGIKPHTRYGNLTALMLFGGVILLIKLQLKLPDDLIAVAGIKYDINKIFEKSLPVALNSLAVSDLIISTKKDFVSNLPEIFSEFTMAVTIIWLIIRRRLILFLIPVAALLLFFTIVYVNAWHMGIVFFIWLFVLWISFENAGAKTDKSTRYVKSIITYALVITLTIQSCWTINSFVYDFNNSYSASRETANYIKEGQLDNKKIYASNFHSISILPYFPGNIFCNYNNRKQPSFWIWSHQNSMYREPYLATDIYDPDIIVLGIKNYTPNESNIQEPFIPEIPGYRFARLFSGALYWKVKPLETDSFAIYERAAD